jgi:hypothetical protein
MRLLQLPLLVFVTPCLSWTVPAYMDLVWPPRWTTDIGDAYIVKNGERQPGYTNDLGSCLNKPVPRNVSRTKFPLRGGAIKFAFVNNSQVDTGDQFSVDMYFADEPYNKNPYFRAGGLKRMASWGDFATGMTCSVPVEIFTRLKDPSNPTSLDSLDGYNVTFALLINVNRLGSHFERVDQVSFTLTVTFRIP